jgi:hypothetical protein
MKHISNVLKHVYTVGIVSNHTHTPSILAVGGDTGYWLSYIESSVS